MFAKTFRNTLIASTLIIAGAALATPANAQLSDTVPLSGSVTSTTAIKAIAYPAAGNLNLGGEGTATPGVVVNVANLEIWSNNTAGVTVTATADTGLSAGGTDVVAYQVKIDAEGTAIGDVVFAVDPEVTTDSVDVVRGGSGLVDGFATRDLFIKYDAPSMLGVGQYTGNILVEIADNT